MVEARKFRKLVEKVKEMGIIPLASTFVIAVHVLQVMISYRLDKRIKAWYLVYKIFAEKGLIKKGSCLVYAFLCGEEVFLERFVKSYEENAPRLLELYKKELAISEKVCRK
ncbi:hypothetical protein CDL12_29249 [Handroanthus impetiginosus]|uniref:Uncharacterized protein n=1 Tax=Handroanthus impetiginosus TaxID=429701 RepID=A0A2G9FZF6_9LAMI|nr:hypothetical protein CDL12_29249 [Handroanthus impetiginosus]